MIENYKMGWIPDLPDLRDMSGDKILVPEATFTLANEELPRAPAKPYPKLPARVDIRSGFSKIEDQGRLGSCTAQAGVALVEYMERKFHKNHMEGSRLFVYKNTRRLSGLTGDSGAYLRDTMKALVMFGVSDEKFWPYDISKFDAEPDAFNYSLASNFKTLKYFRVDQTGLSQQRILEDIKVFLSRGLPLMFGTTVYQGIYNVNSTNPIIPAPSTSERPIGGHAMVLCGYDDLLEAFLVRNSWGEGWGQGGYGYLPYEYVLQGLAVDIWGTTKQSLIDAKAFN